jgi:hypothetical protein
MMRPFHLSVVLIIPTSTYGMAVLETSLGCGFSIPHDVANTIPQLTCKVQVDIEQYM